MFNLGNHGTTAGGVLSVLVCGALLIAAKEGRVSDGKAGGRTDSKSRAVEIQIERSRAVIANHFLAWETRFAEKRVKTAVITNRRTNRTSGFDGEDFVLELADGSQLASSQFQLERATEEATQDGRGKRLVLQLAHGALRVKLITQLKPDEWWATRRLEISGDAGELAAVTFVQWRCAKPRGPARPGKIVDSLGFPNECGQPLYVDDLFLGIVHPGAQNFVRDGGIACRLPAYDKLGADKTVRTREFVVGAGEAGGARRAFLGYIDATRPVAARMICLVNDWYWKDKSRPVEAIKAVARVKQESGLPVDSFTLDDGWDFDWDEATGLWGRLDRKRFPGGWESLEAAGRPADINISLWFGPIGGYGVRKRRIEFARTLGFEINGDKLCLAGPRYRRHVVKSFSQWAAKGMDYIKVDGFWPDCRKTDHGHPVGPGGAIAQMDTLMEVFDAWRQARPKLVIGYTSGSNPSPFWLQHCDFVWRGGADDSHAGVGEPFDRHNTFLDGCLQALRDTEMPVSAIVTFDIVQGRTAGGSEEGFERGVWWLAARTSLHHDWYVQAGDLKPAEWKLLARAAKWAKQHETLFRWSRMVGGDPRKGEIYGFAAFDAGRGTLALRNPSAEPRTLEGSPAELLDMPIAARALSYRLHGVYGTTQSLEGTQPATAPLRIELPALGIAVFEIEPKNPKS